MTFVKKICCILLFLSFQAGIARMTVLADPDAQLVSEIAASLKNYVETGSSEDYTAFVNLIEDGYASRDAQHLTLLFAQTSLATYINKPIHNNTEQETVLFTAARDCAVDVVKFLLVQGADKQYRNKDGFNAQQVIGKNGAPKPIAASRCKKVEQLFAGI